VIDDWHGVIHVCVETFLQTFHVVVSSSAAGLATLDASLYAFIFAALEEQNKEKIDLLRHLSLPSLQIVFVARKAVDEEFIVASFLQHTRENCIINR
jgi:hypothetical protein